MRACTANSRATRRGLTLIEVVIMVVVLAMVVPSVLGLVSESAAHRADAVNTTRGAVLATSVIETVLADVASSSPGLGFGALANSTTYLDAPTTGLRARISTVLQPYSDLGFSYQVAIGALVAEDGATNPDASRNIFRVVTVTVTIPSATGPARSMPVSAMVTGS